MHGCHALRPPLVRAHTHMGLHTLALSLAPLPILLGTVSYVKQTSYVNFENSNQHHRILVQRPKGGKTLQLGARTLLCPFALRPLSVSPTRRHGSGTDVRSVLPGAAVPIDALVHRPPGVHLHRRRPSPVVFCTAPPDSVLHSAAAQVALD